MDKWQHYEQEYILPCFELAKKSGIDLHQEVKKNPGKNCVILLVELLQANSMDKFYEEALSLAQSAGCLDERGGMASVRVSWHPYDSNWEAEANWSSGERILTGSDSPTDAILKLIDLLKEELNEVR